MVWWRSEQMISLILFSLSSSKRNVDCDYKDSITMPILEWLFKRDFSLQVILISIKDSFIRYGSRCCMSIYSLSNWTNIEIEQEKKWLKVYAFLSLWYVNKRDVIWSKQKGRTKKRRLNIYINCTLSHVVAWCI
jgi:hypothetical protein